MRRLAPLLALLAIGCGVEPGAHLRAPGPVPAFDDVAGLRAHARALRAGVAPPAAPLGLHAGDVVTVLAAVPDGAKVHVRAGELAGREVFVPTARLEPCDESALLAAIDRDAAARERRRRGDQDRAARTEVIDEIRRHRRAALMASARQREARQPLVARSYYEAILREFPGTPEAEEAVGRIAGLSERD